ncbi:MAG: 50S ribosomal protein L6 [Candidatus Pacebacteria bacterium]|nr:50S ribosomal protein L6 [Candidatus Paceibacterota bacterium]
MSRVGIKPIPINSQVKVTLKDNLVTVAGPLGVLSQIINPGIKVEIKQQEVVITRKEENRMLKSLHGLSRSLIANMIYGVSQGWQKRLEIQGVGYRANLNDKNLVLSVGFSHQVEIEPPEGIEFAVNDTREIVVSGIDKVLVGNVAAKIRKIRPPDAYKGKGIRYQGEVVKTKPGKAGKVGAAGGGA